MQAAVDGRCLLYANSVTFGPRSVCVYVMAVAALFQLLYCICRAGLSLLTYHPVAKVKFLLPCAIADVLASVLTLVSAGVVSRGFSVMCSKIFYPKPDRCGTAEVWISLVLWLVLIVVDILSLVPSGLISHLPFRIPFLGSLNRRLGVESPRKNIR
ncbi:hypothetical protein C0Q70_14172 [Pomacea canaliculata]|uniref:Uncharacterized protein n=1 Tax=Pomacea canaliculata TaxID=400727 RepID=A0A2T7NZ95_POMCA|nr:hypothetical protein C0Q70_14172 [Pomacea canaliculata]